MFQKSTAKIVAALERNLLRNIVLLKHLAAYPNDTLAHQISDGSGLATLVLLKVAASAYDQRTYATARYAALITSDDSTLTQALLQRIPRGVGIIFKLSSDADRDVVAQAFAIQRVTSVLSFTSGAAFTRDEQAEVTPTPDDDAYHFFAAQDHSRAWLDPLLESGRAFACILRSEGRTLAACFAFENYDRVWEIGGVYTPPDLRGRGFAGKVVRAAITELRKRDLIPRYQVQEDNAPSIRLAESIGLQLFLTTTHFLRAAAP